MLTVKSLRFDDFGWVPLQRTDSKLVWGNAPTEPSDVLTLYYFAVPPDMPAPLVEIDKIRIIYRNAVNQQGGGLLVTDVVDINSFRALKTIFKYKQEPTGMTYIGSISVPFKGFSFVVKLQSFEVGMTGAREAVVMAHMLQSGEAAIDSANNKIKGWNRDPYDPSTSFPMMPNIAELEKYDTEFPDHPLSRLRRSLTRIQTTMEFDADVFNAEPY